MGSAAVALVQGESEHAQEALNAIGTPLSPGFQNDFGVAGGCESVPAFNEFRAELGIVIDAAIKRDGKAEGGVNKRLVRGIRKIDDSQAAMAEADRAAQDDTSAVWAARRHYITHSLDTRSRRDLTIEAQLAAYSAHIGSGLLSRISRAGGRVARHPVWALWLERRCRVGVPCFLTW